MDDTEIIQLYWDRNERAIPASSDKYGGYCTAIARNILENREDAEECVNDTYLAAWNSIPPHRPKVLSSFFGKITRNLSINLYKRNAADKRGGSRTKLVLDEIGEGVSAKDSVEQEIDRRELIRAVDAFLGTLSVRNRTIFVRRYWYFDSVSDIAVRFGVTENNVSVTLMRLRIKLRDYLLERGFEL